MDLPGTPTLKTDRLILRAHAGPDAPGLIAQCNDPLARRRARTPRPYVQEHADWFIGYVAEAWADPHHEEMYWAIDASPSGGPKYCGTVDLHREGPTVWEIAYGSTPEARGHGYVTEAVRAVTSHAFGELVIDG